MAMRIFMIVLGVAAALLGTEIYQLASARAGLDDVPAGYGVMPESADLTVVEFMDYTCKYCQQAHPIIMEAVKRDGHVRYIPRPVAFSKESAVAALLVYNAGQQGKFMEAHDALIGNYRAIDDGFIADFAKTLGLDQNGLKQTAEEAKKHLRENARLFKNMGGEGTPSFAIGQKIFFSPEGRMPTVDDFLKMFKDARAGS